MNNIEFSKSFWFSSFKFNRYHYTDSLKGALTNYLGHLKRGSARIVSQGRSIRVSSGDWFFIPKGLSYQSYWESDDYVEWDSYGFSYYPEASDFPLQKIMLGEDEKRATDMLYESIRKESSKCKAVGLLYLLFGNFAAVMERESSGEYRSIEAKMKQIILDDCTADIPMVAEKLGISTSGLYSVFKKHLSVTPNDFRRRIICEKAEELLCNTDISVEEISNMLGFSSSSYFRKVLMKEIGKTPSAIRKSAKF